jgi:hypothetical protein
MIEFPPFFQKNEIITTGILNCFSSKGYIYIYIFSSTIKKELESRIVSLILNQDALLYKGKGVRFLLT